MDELTRCALAARDGDRDALARFVRLSQADVWRFCAHQGHAGAADDLTQETYLRAIPALRRFRGDSSARTWLLGIARRTCIDDIRRRVRRRAAHQRFLVLAASVPAPDPTGQVDLAELLAGLDPDRRAAFVLTQELGLSYEEAAQVCGCPIGTIRSRVARARGDLLSALDERPSADTTPARAVGAGAPPPGIRPARPTSPGPTALSR